MKKLALLLSGGVDSIALAWWLRPRVAITIDYGQKTAESEICAASAVAEQLRIEHVILRTDLRAVGSGSLAEGELPIAPTPDWWPFRNQLLLTLGASIAVKSQCHSLAIGTVCSDDQYVDGTLEWLNAISNVIKMQEGRLEIEYPAIRMTTQELVFRAGVPSGILAWSHSCNVSPAPCGNCSSCQKQFEIFSRYGLL